MKFTQDVKDRFWEKVDVAGDDNCWLWTAGTYGGGYGKFYLQHTAIAGGSIGAHRFSWMLAHDRMIPEGMEVCHTCDNPLCVNPIHLWIGTRTDNQRDCWTKGRRTHQGEDNARSILTRKQVVQIKKAIVEADFEWGDKRAFCKYWAKKFGVNWYTIENLLFDKTWKHVTI